MNTHKYDIQARISQYRETQIQAHNGQEFPKLTTTHIQDGTTGATNLILSTA